MKNRSTILLVVILLSIVGFIKLVSSQVTFKNCYRHSTGKQIEWTIDETNNEFRALVTLPKANGWGAVGFKTTSSGMTGANIIMAYQGTNNVSNINDYYAASTSMPSRIKAVGSSTYSNFFVNAAMNYTGNNLYIHLVRRLTRPSNAPTTYFQFTGKSTSYDLLFALQATTKPKSADSFVQHSETLHLQPFTFYTQQNYSINCNATAQKNIPVLPSTPPAPAPTPVTNTTNGTTPDVSTSTNNSTSNNRTAVSSSWSIHHSSENSFIGNSFKWICFIACFVTMYIMRND